MATQKQVETFIETLGKLAQTVVISRKSVGKKWSLPSICIAQAALETGWGTSDMMVKANAYFGIKAGSSWKGKVYSSKTKECYDGSTYVTITDCFRAYDSLKESVEDYFALICDSTRYAKACGVTDANTCITEIKNAGYATSPTYIQNIMSIVNKYNLTRFDDVVKSGSASIKKSIDEVAREVIDGKWGNGSDRKNNLTQAGYDYGLVQEKVNNLLAAKSPNLKSVTEIAKEVIAGKWGNNPERKEKLTKAGYNYREVQDKVNQLLR